MAVDNSVADPGPQGWWLNENESHYRTILAERREWEDIEDKAPERVIRQEPKTADPLILDMVKKDQEKRGIDDGVDLLALFLILFSMFPPWLRQLIGSCVASGGMRACTIRSLWEIVVLGEPEELLGRRWEGIDNINHFAPYNYRAGRKIGGLNGGDGSFCGAHIKGLMSYGFLPCDTKGLNSDAYPEPQSTSAYRKWGNSNQLLERFADKGREFDLIESERITDADDLKEVLTVHFKPCMVCSNWAFRPDYKHPTWVDYEGNPVWIYKRDRGNSWAHNMTKAYMVKVKNEWFLIVLNSWGPRAHKNGHWFAIPLTLAAEWLRSAEVRTIGNLALRDSTTPIVW